MAATVVEQGLTPCCVRPARTGQVDSVDKETRSRMMSAVRTRDTAPELRVRKFLHANGFRFRLHVKTLPGCPDVVLPKHKVALFVHGCFWHQHAHCPKGSLPVANREFWATKLEANRRRDAAVLSALVNAGWRAMIIWECETRDIERLDALCSAICSG